MADKQFNARIRWKRDTSANWTSNNPVLLNGEIIIVDTDSGEMRFKIGDGVKTYTQLPFEDEVVRNLININTSAITKLNGDDTTEGSVAKAIADAKSIIDADIDAVKVKADAAQTSVDNLADTVAYINKEDNENIENPDIAASSVIIDSALSRTSANPVQNATITAELDTIKDAKADWNQNDETAIDYIKNRPGGYTADVVKTLYNDTTYTAEENVDFEIVEGQKYVVAIDGENPVEFTAVKETVTEGGGIFDLVYIGTNSYSEITSGSVNDYWFLGFAVGGVLMCSESYIGKHFLITTKEKGIIKIPKKYLDLGEENLIPEIYATKNNNDLTAVEIPANVIRVRVRCINITEVTLPAYPTLLYEVINDNFNDELLTIKYGEGPVGIAPPNCTVYLGYGRSHPVMLPFENSEYAIFSTNESSVIPKIGDTYTVNKHIKDKGYVFGAVIGTIDTNVSSSYVLIKKTGQVDVECSQDMLGGSYKNITSADDGHYIKLIKYTTGQLCKYNYTNVGIEDISWRLAYVKSFDATTNIATVILF